MPVVSSARRAVCALLRTETSMPLSVSVRDGHVCVDRWHRSVGRGGLRGPGSLTERGTAIRGCGVLYVWDRTVICV